MEIPSWNKDIDVANWVGISRPTGTKNQTL